MSERLTATTKEQIGDERDADRTDDHRHRISLHRATDAQPPSRCGIRQDLAFAPAIGRKLARDIAGDMRASSCATAEFIGPILCKAGIVAGAFADQIGPVVPAVVGDLPIGAIGYRSGFARDILQVILRELAGLVGIAAKIAAETAGVVVIEAFEPGQRSAPKGLRRNVFPRDGVPALASRSARP